MDLSPTKIEMLGFIVRLSFLSAVAFYGSRYLMRRFDPLFQSRKKALATAEKQLKRVANNIEKPLSIDSLSQYELMIASNLVHPEDINITWRNIAGLDEVIKELKETIILPIKHKKLLADSMLSSPPKGVLLHGPPGCGKTLIAKATAKEAGMNFINLDVSVLTDKWYGESQKLAGAVFSLGVKLQPCIIFIDEIDSFLRNRSVGDHEATAMMRAQFMSWWDGLITDDNCSVIVMGATNRPRDLDTAILRRMPVRLNIGLPSVAQREKILELVLRHEPIEQDVDCHKLATMTDGFSGSDLKEMCRVAALYRMRDFLDTPTAQGDGGYLRPIVMSDLEDAVEKMRASKVLCVTIPMPTSSLDVE